MQHINLIPPEARKISIASRLRRYLFKSALFRIIISVFVFLSSISIYEVYAIAKYKGKISLQKNKIKQLESQLEDCRHLQETILKEKEKLLGENKYFQRRISFLEEEKKKAIKSSEILSVLSKSFPSDLWLNKISLKKDLVTLNGQTFDNSKISDFMERLERTGYFGTVSFNFIQKSKDKSIIDFEVTTHFARD